MFIMYSDILTRKENKIMGYITNFELKVTLPSYVILARNCVKCNRFWDVGENFCPTCGTQAKILFILSSLNFGKNMRGLDMMVASQKV